MKTRDWRRCQNETKIRIGDIFNLGEAIIQVSQTRKPCFKLGVKFGTQKVIKQFINHPYPGFYARVIKPGEVKTNDSFSLIEQAKNSITLDKLWSIEYNKEIDVEQIKTLLENPYLATDSKVDLEKKLKNF